MVPFGGWDMPLAYSSGTLAEHAACRSAAVIFDVSHLGTVRVEGENAFEHGAHCGHPHPFVNGFVSRQISAARA